jgi:hypothetical protein
MIQTHLENEINEKTKQLKIDAAVNAINIKGYIANTGKFRPVQNLIQKIHLLQDDIKLKRQNLYDREENRVNQLKKDIAELENKTKSIIESTEERDNDVKELKINYLNNQIELLRSYFPTGEKKKEIEKLINFDEIENIIYEQKKNNDNNNNTKNFNK